MAYLIIGGAAVTAFMCIAVGALIDWRAQAASRWTRW